MQEGTWGRAGSRLQDGGSKEGREDKVSPGGQTLPFPNPRPKQAALKGSKFQGLAECLNINRQVNRRLGTVSI